MDIAAIIIGFVAILILNSRKINMGISLFAGTLLAGIIMQYSPGRLLAITVHSIIEPVTLELMVIIAILSGFGFLLKKTGDLDMMIESLISLFKGGRILSMILPTLIGTMAVPGGALLSAPMVDKSGEMIDLDIYTKTSANVFFYHIGYLVYPLYGPMIIVSELSGVSKSTLISYNILPMLFSLLAGYYMIFIRGGKKTGGKKDTIDRTKISKYLGSFLLSFIPILSIIVLTLLLQLPFYLAVFVGLIIAAVRNLPPEKKTAAFINRIKEFLQQGVKYDLIFLIMGVMAFKGIIESSTAVESVAAFLTETGIPLSIMIAIISLLIGYLTGMNMGAVGILIPIFLPIIPPDQLASYLSLLFISSYVGYMVSPIHLCLVLTKEYFKARFTPVYRQLLLPLSLMLLTAVLQFNLL